MTLKHLLYAVTATFIWGFSFVAVKYAQHQFPLIFLVGFRFLAIGLLMIPFVPRPQKHEWKPVAIVAITFGFLNYTLLYIGLKGVSASTGALVHQISVPLIAFGGYFMLKEKITKWIVLGVTIALLGVFIIMGKPSGNDRFLYILILLASACFSALGNIFTKKYGPFNPSMLNGWTSIMAAPLLLLASFTLEDGQIQSLQHADLMGWICVIFTILCSGILAFTLWYSLLNQYPVSKLAPLSLLSPFFAVVSSVIVLGEQLTPQLIIGGLCTIAGVAIVQIRK